MMERTNFLKRVSLKDRGHNANLQKPSREKLPSAQICSLSKPDLKHFRVIGILDKKVIIAYNGTLRMFGYFDLHAVHERIRYQFYCCQIKRESGMLVETCAFDLESIEKGTKLPCPSFGRPKNILVRVPALDPSSLFGKDESKAVHWGITFERNYSNEVYITSYRLILGRFFSQQELLDIFSDINRQKRNIPKLIDEWIGEYACKSAYKFNDDLTNNQAKLLIKNLERCSFPWHCVHGRTTIYSKPFPF